MTFLMSHNCISVSITRDPADQTIVVSRVESYHLLIASSSILNNELLNLQWIINGCEDGFSTMYSAQYVNGWLVSIIERCRYRGSCSAVCLGAWGGPLPHKKTLVLYIAHGRFCTRDPDLQVLPIFYMRFCVQLAVIYCKW